MIKDQLKNKKEQRGVLMSEMESLTNLAGTEGRDSEADTARFEELDGQLTKLDKEITSLEKMEGRQKQIAEQRAKEKDAQEQEARKALDDKKDSEAKVTGNNLKSNEARDAKVFKLLNGVATKNSYIVDEARKSLVEGGHFDDVLGKGEKRNFSTLQDDKGGVLIPTSVSKEIFDIEQQFGFVPQHTNSFGLVGNKETKIPNVLGRPSFYAVSEGGAIQGSGLNLGGLSIKPLKWGCIIDWTTEVDDEVGATLMPIIMKKIAEAQAYVKDLTFFKGDGTKTYNNIKGLESLTGNVNYVRTATAANGNTSFSTLDADDFLLPVENVTPGARPGGYYVMHPNMAFTLRKLKDGQGRYIYGDPSDTKSLASLWGYPVFFSEAFSFTDGATEEVCAFVNPKAIAYGNGRNLTSTLLTEGTITNEDSSSVNLATTDAKAMRFTTAFDIKLDNNTRETAGTKQGHFSVLKTAAS